MLTDEVILREFQNYQNITLNQLPFGFLHLSNAHFCLMNVLNKNDDVQEWKSVICDFFEIYYELLKNFPVTKNEEQWKILFQKRLDEKMQEKDIYGRIAVLEQKTLSILHQFDTSVAFQKKMLQEQENVPKYVWMIFEM